MLHLMYSIGPSLTCTPITLQIVVIPFYSIEMLHLALSLASSHLTTLMSLHKTRSCKPFLSLRSQLCTGGGHKGLGTSLITNQNITKFGPLGLKVQCDAQCPFQAIITAPVPCPNRKKDPLLHSHLQGQRGFNIICSKRKTMHCIIEWPTFLH